MAAYARGDSAAFAELFRRHAPELERVLRRRLPQGEDARDLVQQTFLQVHRARLDFDPQARFRPWFFTIAFNLQRELYRKQRREPAATIDAESAPLAAPAPSAELDDVHRALSTLPAATREVIALHWLEGHSLGEVATRLGASLSAVKVRAHRGYIKLRAYFADPS